MLVADIRRNKALAEVLESATVTDASGNPVDLQALSNDESLDSLAALAAEADEDDETEED
jgi:trigger factor